MPATSSSSYVIISVVLRRSPAEIAPHHHHHAVVLLELIYYFTVARWIEEVKASSSRTCVERGGAVRSALDRKDRDHDGIAGRIVIGSRDGS